MEQSMRQRSMERTRTKLEKLRARVASGGLKARDAIIRAAEKVLGKNHGERYYTYTLDPKGVFEFAECESFEHEKNI
jgi:hypothetical protein